MSYPPLLNYDNEDDYRTYFENTYCRGPILTFDGIGVRFKKKKFSHYFYESVNAKDDTFSIKRAERMDWIKEALQDANSERYIGWDKRRKRSDCSRRVTISKENYVVVILITGTNKANFITAFVADTPRTLELIKTSPPWA